MPLVRKEHENEILMHDKQHRTDFVVFEHDPLQDILIIAVNELGTEHWERSAVSLNRYQIGELIKFLQERK